MKNKILKFDYENLSEKRKKEFKPSQSLGEELKIQRNFYDITNKSNKTNTINKSKRLNHFLKLIDNKNLISCFSNLESLNNYLEEKFKKSNSIEGIECATRFTELEKEYNSKLKKFDRGNYFTSYYFMFRLYNFIDFNTFIELLKKYNVKFKYSENTLLELPLEKKNKFNIYNITRYEYNFYSFILPILKSYNIQEQVEISLKIGEPTYFISDLINKKIQKISYSSAKNLLEFLGVTINNNFSINDFLSGFNILDDKTLQEQKEFEDFIIEKDYENFQEDQKLIPFNFGYIYNNNSIENFSFKFDLENLLSKINCNLENFIDESLKDYNIFNFLEVLKVLTNIKLLTDNINESKKILSLPLSEDIDSILSLYVQNINKNYYSKPESIVLLDPVEFKEDGEEEILSVYVPKLKSDYIKNSNKYQFDEYFKSIYKKSDNL